jgi:CHAD domain-containing protein
LSPTENIEREVKLEVGLRFALPDLNGVLPGVVAVDLPLAKLRAVYVDTPDLRLMRWGITLRHRHDTVAQGTGESDWTVKLPHEAGGVALVRREVSWPGKFGPVPPEVASLVRAYARSSPIGAVAKLNTQRRRVELRDAAGTKLAEVDDDVVSVMDGRILAARFREVEVEIAPGAPETLLDAVLGRMTAAGALSGDDRPKVVRALGPRATSKPDVVVANLGSEATIADVVAASIATAVTRMVRHDLGVRLGDDPEHVHQARVGTRRLRSDLRTFRSLLDPEWTSRVRGELGWLAAALGDVRDADVLTERLRALIAALPDSDARPAAGLLRRLALQRNAARARMLVALDSDRYVALLDELAAASARPPLAASGVEGWSEAAMTSDLPGIAPAPGCGRAERGETALRGGRADKAAGANVAAANGDAGLVGRYGPVATAPVTTAPVTTAPVTTAPAPTAPAPTAPAPTAQTAPALFAPTQAPPGPATGPPTTTPVPPAPATPPARGTFQGERAPDPNRPWDGSAPAALVGDAGLPDDAASAGRLVPLGDRPAREVLPRLVRQPWRHLLRAATGLGDDPPDEALHEVRIQAKRLRYAAEAAEPVIGNPARRLAAAVAEVQGVLGDMQDAVVAEAWLRQAGSSGSAGQALVAGILIARQRDQQAACREAWIKPWQKASRKRLRRWLKD